MYKLTINVISHFVASETRDVWPGVIYTASRVICDIKTCLKKWNAFTIWMRWCYFLSDKIYVMFTQRLKCRKVFIDGSRGVFCGFPEPNTTQTVNPTAPHFRNLGCFDKRLSFESPFVYFGHNHLPRQSSGSATALALEWKVVETGHSIVSLWRLVLFTRFVKFCVIIFLFYTRVVWGFFFNYFRFDVINFSFVNSKIHVKDHSHPVRCISLRICAQTRNDVNLTGRE